MEEEEVVIIIRRQARSAVETLASEDGADYVRKTFRDDEGGSAIDKAQKFLRRWKD